MVTDDLISLAQSVRIILKTIISENQGPSENPTNVDEETLEKFLES